MLSGGPTHDGRFPARIGAAAGTDSLASRTSHAIPYARATSSIVSIGSLTRTTPPWFVQYFVEEASIDMTRDAASAPAWVSVVATASSRWRRSSQTPWTATEPATAQTSANPTTAPVKIRLALAASHEDRRLATHWTATSMPSRARM